ncbi:type II toxin-antitoxin system prevent-host-death family antitoxin [Nitrosomonas europaea]
MVISKNGKPVAALVDAEMFAGACASDSTR